MAGSSSVVTNARGWASPNPDGLIRLDVNYVADDSTGAIPDVTTDSFAGLIVGVTHNPGATAPTTLMDVVATDSNGIDVLCGAGANIVTTANMTRVPYPDSTSYGPFPFVGQLTVSMSGNSVNSATGVFSIFLIQDTNAG